MFRRLLHRLLSSRDRDHSRPDFGPLPPQPSDDAPEWLMERLGNGVKRHFPVSGPVERGASPSASVTGTKQLHEQAAEEFPHNLKHAHGIAQRPGAPLFRAAGNRHDGTAGRLP